MTLGAGKTNLFRFGFRSFLGRKFALGGATNFLVLEGIETQDIVSALERHGTRYGYPAEVYVDYGSQLAALDQSKVILRDANTFLYNSRGTTVTVSCPKAHESRGKVKRKI